ncbi:MAG: XRE family transcriptional regulator [Candidatus Omnitrophica bacterium]|nr:XRE family transcriptional regulator [Candidatus Omnitrophota bacterium]MDD5352252.1 XRE family transcriptional regulator [Candidatus Omnitrophota bacterium]MDD5549850.1 XRE family transcriptional regulator [Candidatus Omnitrophota bacterium]
MNIGEKLKRLRKSRDLTLDDIAKKSGVGKATLSRIENDITQGTLKTHMKICEALNLNLKDLYEGLDIPKEEITTLSEKTTNETEIFSYDERAKSVILTKNAQRNSMLPQLLILEPQGKTHLEQNTAGTEKFVYCTEGQIHIDIEDKQYELKKGTSLYFKSSLPHRFINIGKKPAKCLVISSPAAL